MKIVVPVDTDKHTIYKRTGKAPFFNIYDNEQLIDTIVNNHAYSHYDEDDHDHTSSEENVEHHRQDIQNLKGCDIMLAQAVGENMAKALELIGLKVQKISKVDGDKAMKVVVKFLSHKLKRQ